MWRVLAFLFTGAWHDCGKFGHNYMPRYGGSETGGHSFKQGRYIRDICTTCGQAVEAPTTEERLS